jgi:tartrate-resistant acid phosphatase type 5
MAARLAVVFLATLALARGDGLNFLIVGDWGGQDTTPYSRPGEIAAAAGMASVSTQIGASFVLGLGDNFYYTGAL